MPRGVRTQSLSKLEIQSLISVDNPPQPLSNTSMQLLNVVRLLWRKVDLVCRQQLQGTHIQSITHNNLPSVCGLKPARAQLTQYTQSSKIEQAHWLETPYRTCTPQLQASSDQPLRSEISAASAVVVVEVGAGHGGLDVGGGRCVVA